MENERVYVSVIGSGECNDGIYQLARKVGNFIAERNGILVNGGLGGVMEGASKGAKESGGTTVGIIPSDNKDHANKYIDIVIPTGLGEARNTLVVRSGDVVIAVGGEYGTLSEIGFALKIGKPIIGINTWELRKKGNIESKIVVVYDADEAVNQAFKEAKRIS